MAKVPSSVLLDVNVWLDNYLPGRPSAGDSRSLLDWLYARDVSILYPVTAPGTVFYLVQQGMKQIARADSNEVSQEHAKAISLSAWACIDNMAELGAPVGADASDFWVARKLRSVHPDLEDNFVLAAAERAQVDYLVTGDEALLKKATVPALLPRDLRVPALQERVDQGAPERVVIVVFDFVPGHPARPIELAVPQCDFRVAVEVREEAEHERFAESPGLAGEIAQVLDP